MLHSQYFCCLKLIVCALLTGFKLCCETYSSLILGCAAENIFIYVNLYLVHISVCHMFDIQCSFLLRCVSIKLFWKHLSFGSIDLLPVHCFLIFLFHIQQNWRFLSVLSSL